jgi:Na+/H+ antiporter NhaD/arsenite permease-like protein
VPGLIALALASNIGGTTTMIGDPPNILIASHIKTDFVTFLIDVGPVAIITLICFLAVAAFVGKWREPGSPESRARVLAMDESGLITDPRLLRISLFVLAVTIAGFLLQGWLGYEPAAVALTGGVLILLITRSDPHHQLVKVEWNTLFFFIGLFIVVGGLEKTGVLETVGQRAVELTNGSLSKSMFLVLWMSAFLSGVIDNIPYTATMLPILDGLNEGLKAQGHPSNAIWWALAIGADMGGNMTIIGASANVLIANIAERNGHRIRFVEFLKWGVPTVFGTMVIATVYLWLHYLAF